MALFLFVYQKGHLGTKRFKTAAPFSPQFTSLPSSLVPFARYDVIWLFDFCRHDKIQNVAWQLYWLMAPRPFRPFVSEGVSEACDGFNECLTPPPPAHAHCAVPDQSAALVLLPLLLATWCCLVVFCFSPSGQCQSCLAASYLALHCPLVALLSCVVVVVFCCAVLYCKCLNNDKPSSWRCMHAYISIYMLA